jgi:hypothetical protein
MQFYNSYMSNEPQNETIGVVVIIAGVTAVFAFYDYLSNHRMKTLSAFANITSKMVDDIFPRTVKERLIQAKQKEVREAKENLRSARVSSHRGGGGRVSGLNAGVGSTRSSMDAMVPGSPLTGSNTGVNSNRRRSIGLQIMTGMSGFISSRLAVPAFSGTPKQRSRAFSLQDRPIADHFPSVTARNFRVRARPYL